MLRRSQNGMGSAVGCVLDHPTSLVSFLANSYGAPPSQIASLERGK